MALFSTGSAWSSAAPFESGPANTTNCVFDHNNATDGGAIYSAAGYDIVRDCWFEANFAGVQLMRSWIDFSSQLGSYQCLSD